LDGVLVDDNTIGIAEGPRMYPRKVTEVSKVLELARRIRVPDVWAARDDAPVGGLEFRHFGYRPARFVE
jgi:hypothetical protein